MCRSGRTPRLTASPPSTTENVYPPTFCPRRPGEPVAPFSPCKEGENRVKNNLVRMSGRQHPYPLSTFAPLDGERTHTGQSLLLSPASGSGLEAGMERALRNSPLIHSSCLPPLPPQCACLLRPRLPAFRQNPSTRTPFLRSSCHEPNCVPAQFGVGVLTSSISENDLHPPFLEEGH